MTTLAEIKTAMSQFGGEAWVECLTIRGQPGGGLKAAELKAGRRIPGAPLMPEIVLPFNEPTGDKAFDDVIAAIGADGLKAIAERDALAEQVATLTTERDAAIEAIAAKDAEIAKLNTAVAALGTTEQGLALAKQQQIERLKEQKAAAEAELAKLEAPQLAAVKK